MIETAELLFFHRNESVVRSSETSNYAAFVSSHRTMHSHGLSTMPSDYQRAFRAVERRSRLEIMPRWPGLPVQKASLMDAGTWLNRGEKEHVRSII